MYKETDTPVEGTHMQVVFVMGPQHAGKTTYVRESFDPRHRDDVTYVDILAVQSELQTPSTVEEIKRSYDVAAERLAEACEAHRGTDHTVVFEHTLLRGMRRPQFIDAARAHMEAGDTLSAVWVDVDDERTLAERLGTTARLRGDRAADFCAGQARRIREVAEVPEDGEGFDDVTVVMTSGMRDWDASVVADAAIKAGYAGDDPEEADMLLRMWSHGYVDSDGRETERGRRARELSELWASKLAGRLGEEE